MSPGAATVYLGLGSNLGDRRAHLQDAVDALAAAGIEPLASSSVYETAPVGDVPDQPPFLNACLCVSTALEPEPLLDAVKRIELELGRAGGVRHGPREIDIDLLLLAPGESHANDRLRVPHPALLERRFLLVCLLELDFELATPAGERLADALVTLAPADQAVRLAGPPLRLTRSSLRPR